MSIANFSVRNPVLVNLLMIGLFIFGFISLFRMPTELNSPVPFNWVFITVIYPGASPAETESLIVDPLEAEIKNVDRIEEIQSTAGEGFGFVLIKFEDMSEDEFLQKYNEIKSEVDKVELPNDAEDPILDDFNSSDFLPVITINMSFRIPEANAQKIAQDLQNDIEDLPGVARVQVSGLGEREIWVEVDPAKMNSLNITFEEILFALKARNINVPGGNISFGKTEYLIRSLGEYNSIEEIDNTIIRKMGSSFIRVKDVADVNDRREEVNILSRLNSEQSITFSLSKKADANSIDVIDEVKVLIQEYEQKIPDGIEFGWTNDNSVYILRIINVLRNNALTGMVLIFLILVIFLGKSNAFLASLGIPISFFITFIFMDITDNSLNGNTLFALVMVLGIIVDDAIIVIENCHRYRLLGYNSFDAAVLGTNEVVRPILSSIGTNIAAFLPLILLPGIMGKFLRIIPIVFSLALIASIFEAFFLLPSHYADWTQKSKVYKKGEKKFFKNIRKKYENILVRVLRRRYWAISFSVVVFLLSVGIGIPLLGVELFPDDDMDQIRILVWLPEGTSLEETDRVMHKYEKEALKIPESELQDIITNVGLLQGDEEWQVKKNVAQVLVQLQPQEVRKRNTDEIIETLRERCQYISGPISVQFAKITGGPPVGNPISVKVQGKYLEDIKRASLALQDSINRMQGAYDVSDNFPPGKEEIRINIDEDQAALYGFTTQFVALNVRYAFDGAEATEFRDGDDEIDVIVKYDEKNRTSIDDVLNLRISNLDGRTVALREMVDFEIRPGPTEIRRFDQKRTIMVTGEINEEETSLDNINQNLADLFPKLEKVFPGVSFAIGGQFEEFTRTFDNILSLFILAIILIFLILGTQFNSYSQPLVIIATIPFALIGAVVGLIISGNPFSIVSLFGFVALAGIVVNDAIILITFVNNRRIGKGTSIYRLWRSIVDSGRVRLRPILLTSLTTISGLMPLAFGIGGMSEMWAPLANVILFGLLVSTVLTLFIIPCLLAILDDIKGARKRAVVY